MFWSLVRALDRVQDSLDELARRRDVAIRRAHDGAVDRLERTELRIRGRR